jgi:flavin reductase (DIM6/NTAB) family NADH-FMN oxidoreductase RutF
MHTNADRTWRSNTGQLMANLAGDRDGTVFYEPGKDHGLRHDPLMSIIAPRPIGWIGSRSASGVNNLAPFSFFNLLSHTPPILAFCCNGPKDTPLIVGETGDFSWNLATRPLAERMNASSAPLPIDEDEFAFSGLTPVQGRKISAPLVAESPVSMECRVIEIIQLRDIDGNTASGKLVLGQIVGIHIAQNVIVDGVYDLIRAQPISRAGGIGDYYQPTADGYFHMPKPSLP